MKTLSHDAVAERARQIWQNYGCPEGQDVAIWCEAERQLTSEAPRSKANDDSWSEESSRTLKKSGTAKLPAAQLKAEAAAESMVENHISPAVSDEAAIGASIPKQKPAASHQT